MKLIRNNRIIYFYIFIILGDLFNHKSLKLFMYLIFAYIMNEFM